MKRTVFNMKRHKYTWAEIRARFESENNGLFDKIRKDMEELRDKEVTEEEAEALKAQIAEDSKKVREAEAEAIRIAKEQGKTILFSYDASTPEDFAQMTKQKEKFEKKMTEEEKADLDAYFKEQTEKSEASLDGIRKLKQEGRPMVSSGIIDMIYKERMMKHEKKRP